MTYQLDYDAQKNRVTARIYGLWTVPTVHLFSAAIGTMAGRLRASRDDFDVLIDSRDFAVQTQEVAELLPSITEGGMTMTHGRAAAVVGSTLNLLQAERTQSHPRLRIFMTMEEAEAWLAAPTPPRYQTENRP